MTHYFISSEIITYNRILSHREFLNFRAPQLLQTNAFCLPIAYEIGLFGTYPGK